MRTTTTRRFPSGGLGLLAALLTAPAADATTIAGIVREVSQAHYTDLLKNQLYTRTGNNRGVNGTQHDLARTNILNFLHGYGLATALEPFSYSGKTYSNVVAVKPGLVHPERIYLVGAHYDSVNNPGADDNASGVAGVLEAARVISRHAFEATIVFVAFDREEQGLIGSTRYAAGHAADQIQGMISMDMIGYSAGDLTKARICYNLTNSTLTGQLAESLQIYGNGIVGTIGKMGRSDHEPFANKGFNAALLIEYNFATNPHYHKATDSVDTANYLDYGYATNLTRGVVGWLAGQAGLIDLAMEYTSDGIPTAGEEELRWLINRTRFDPAAENAHRGTAHPAVPATAGPLAPHQGLTAAARRHSLDMATLNVFRHETIPGSAYYDPVTQPSPADRLTAEGFLWSGVGETIAAASPTAEQTYLGWWDAPDDRATLLQAAHREVGCGHAFNQQADAGHYHTADFAVFGAHHFFTDTLFHDANANGQYDESEGRGGLTITLRVNGAVLPDFDVATAVGSFAIPLDSVSAGATVEVALHNPTASAVEFSLPRDFHASPALTLEPGQSQIVGMFTKASGTENVGFRNLTQVPATPPVFSPAAGKYAVGQALTITGESGTTIVFRVNDGAEQAAASPVTTLSVPPYPAVLTISAFARKAGFLDSPVTEATFIAAAPYETWTATWFPGVTDPAMIGWDADPDHDGQLNAIEFALGGIPGDSGVAAALHQQVVVNEATGAAGKWLLTIAVRAGTPIFSGDPAPSATHDGVTYRVQGGTDLADFNLPVLALEAAIDHLPPAPTGYEYRTFGLAHPGNLPAQGYLRVGVTPAP
jgi:hypothetical protein